MALNNFLLQVLFLIGKSIFPIRNGWHEKLQVLYRKKVNPYILLNTLSYSHSYASIICVCAEDCPDYCKNLVFWFWELIISEDNWFLPCGCLTMWMDGLNFKARLYSLFCLVWIQFQSEKISSEGIWCLVTLMSVADAVIICYLLRKT